MARTEEKGRTGGYAVSALGLMRGVGLMRVVSGLDVLGGVSCRGQGKKGRRDNVTTLGVL